MARARAGFAPGGHVQREHLAALDQVGERRQPPAESRHGLDVRDLLLVLGPPGRGIVSRRRRTEHARDLGLVEQRQEDADPLDDRSAQLGVERHPVVPVPSFDGLDLLGVLPRPALPPSGSVAVLDLQLPKQGCAFRIEAARHGLGAGRHVPVPVLEGLPVRIEIPRRRSRPAWDTAAGPAPSPPRSSVRTASASTVQR